MVKAQAEVLGQVAGGIPVQLTGRDRRYPEHPLDPIRPESNIPAYPSTPFVQARDLDLSQPLSPLVVAEGRDQSYHKGSPLLYLIVSTSTSPTNPLPRNAYARSARRCRSRDVNGRGKPWL